MKIFITSKGEVYLDSVYEKLAAQNAKLTAAYQAGKHIRSDTGAELRRRAGILTTLRNFARPITREEFFKYEKEGNEAWSYKWPKRWQIVVKADNNAIDALLRLGYLAEL